MESKIRTTVCFHRLGPYHLARLRGAYEEIPGLSVLEWSATDTTYAWAKEAKRESFPIRTLIPDRDAEAVSAGTLHRAVQRALDPSTIDCLVVNGWGFRTSLTALKWALSRGIPAVCMSESTAWDESRNTTREWIKRRLVSLFSAGLVGGAPHASYLQQLGMPTDRIFLGYDAVDNAYFTEGASSMKCNRRDGESAPPHFLASARFIPKKNLLGLLDAYRLYFEKSKVAGTRPWGLVALGDGALRQALIDRCDLLKLPWRGGTGYLPTAPESPAGGWVRFPGFIQYPELPRYYGAASVFVHASTTEQWGLVVNEAMASGLPVLVSNRCGCARDLVQEGVNGFTFNPYDVDELAQLMLRVSANGFPLPAFGAASQRIISEWGPERFASGLKAAAEMAVKVGPKKASLLDRLLLEALIRWR